jgi:hypothetical protein
MHLLSPAHLPLMSCSSSELGGVRLLYLVSPARGSHLSDARGRELAQATRVGPRWWIGPAQ